MKQDQEPLWLNWTRNHPKLAALLWPTIAEVARRQHYPFVPEMFQLASNAEDAARFREDLDRLLGRKYADLAANRYDVGAYDEAIRLFTLALKHLPGDPATLAARADAYQAAGELDKAADDLRQARQAGRE
jgi:tetratricopeptide (TPR) repeat protein